MTYNNCRMEARLLTILLLCSLLNKLTSAEETSYKVPNPFSGLTKDTANDFYHIRATQKVNDHHERIDEFFSLGKGLAFTLHENLNGRGEPWALLVDGREARSYIVSNANAWTDQQVHCQLDHLHSYKHLFPWQYVYDINEVTKQTEEGSKPNKATIYGIGAIWLNLIHNKVHSNDVGAHSQYRPANSWKLTEKNLEVEMLFDKTANELSEDYATAQCELDKTEPKRLKVTADVRYKDSSVERQVENLSIEKFASGLKEKFEPRLQRFRAQLEICKRTNKQYQQFPNLLRAMASWPERLYKIYYATKKYDSYGLGELYGKYSEKHHRFLGPNELVIEVFSLNHDVQTILYIPSTMDGQEMSGNGRQTDQFMSRFTENAASQSARHATAYYHVMRNYQEKHTSCIRGEREPKPKYRLLSSPFTFHTAKGVEYEGHIHGLGAILMNAAHLHHKSFSLLDLEIRVPISQLNLNKRRPAQVRVWQVFDNHDNVRVLFFFEKRNLEEEPFSWDLADRDRKDLARLVRVDLRRALADVGDQMSLTIDQASIDDEKDMLAQFFIFSFKFELWDHEKKQYLEVPSECKADTSSAEDQDSSDEDEDLIDETEDNYDKPYDESKDSDNPNPDKKDDHEADLASEFEQLEGLEKIETPLPDFIEMLGDQTSYQFVIRVELLNDAGQAKKSIWLVETIDLTRERMLLEVYLTRMGLHWEEPYMKFYIAYKDELVFRVTENRHCFRIDDVDSLWMRLFSGHLYYHVNVPAKEHKHNENPTDSDLVIESNRLSTYGISALWRRASESGLAEYLGTRRERLERDGHRYRQLEWLYLEYDMSIRFTFLLEENQDGGHLSGAKHQLESVLFSNNYDAELTHHFRTIKVNVERYEAGISALVVVPLECQSQYLELMEQGHVLMRPPTYEDVLGTSGTYEIRYTVQDTRKDGRSGLCKWNVRESFDRKLNRGKIVIIEPVSGIELEIYIDGQSKRMFAMSKLAGQCSIITSLGPAYNSIISSLVFNNQEFDPKRMHGLLGLWQMLSKKHANVHIKQDIGISGEKHEEHVYRYEQVEPPKADRPEVREEIKMYFNQLYQIDQVVSNSENNDEISKRLEDRLAIRRVEIRTIQNRSSQEQAEEYTTKIYIGSQFGQITEDWSLPEDCKQLLGPGLDDASISDVSPDDQPPSESPPIGNFEFPKLSYLFGRSNRFHMRAEVSIKSALDTLFLVDEFFNEGDVRLRTRGIGEAAETNCDLLMFSKTLDQFDLSTPLKCERLRDNEASHCLHTSLNEVWLTDGMVRVDKLSDLHYGPLTLWKLAEKAAKSGGAKLIKTLKLSTRQLAGQSLEIYKQALERELNREVWLISGQNSDWSYEMKFVKHQRPLELDDGTEAIDEWHVLENITASDIQDGTKISVFIDVVNYNYQPDNDEFRALFRLPEGWNCRREFPESAKLPELDLGSLRSGVQLDYEASLELFDVEKRLVYEDDELGPCRVEQGGVAHLPTVLGAYWMAGNLLATDKNTTADNKSKESEQQFDQTVHQTMTRFADGTVHSRRIITDRERQLEYEVDTMSGSCEANKVPDSSWKLNFRSDDSKKSHLVKLFTSTSDLRRHSSKDLFTQLFLKSPGASDEAVFSLVNKYEVEDGCHKLLVTSYEREYDLVELTDNLYGPARVVRKYERSVGSDESESTDSMTAKMYLLSPDKLGLQAILTIQLQVSPPARLSEFLSLASVTDCFNEMDPLAHRHLQKFTLEYPILKQFSQDIGRVMAPILQDYFYANLLRLRGYSLGQFFPLQLDGRGRIEFSQHDRLVRVHFDVMEAPTAIVYFHTNFQCTMTDEMVALAESRHLPNEAACSRWCDQVNCVVMSYCADHLCQVATEKALYESSVKIKNKSSQNEGPYSGSLAACMHHESCTHYHYKPGIRPPTLSRLRDYLDRIVNRGANEKQLKTLGLPLDSQMSNSLDLNGRVTPTRFYDSGEMFRWQHENFDDPFAVQLNDADSITVSSNTTGGLQVAASSFALWKRASRFDVNKIDKLNEELKFGHDSKFIVSWAIASNQANCLQECQRNHCLLVTSCKNENRCGMIIATGSKSIMSLGALKRELVKPNSPDCTIFIRDHLDKFHLFEDSQKPDKFSRRLDDLTAPECAAACQLSKAQCLAFDLCTFFDETTGQLPERSVCFLQHDHVAQDSFDRSVLLPSWEADRQASNRSTIDNRLVSCDHYSKSVVVEFLRVPNAKLKDLHASVLRGVSVEKCAADCLQDDTCRAFEHCLNLRRHPTQSCYLIQAKRDEADWLDSLREEQVSVGTDVIESKREKFDSHLALSRSCSIYVAKITLLHERVDHTLSLEVCGDQQFLISSILLVCVYLLIASLIGVILQFVYIRTTGRTALSLRPS